MTNIFQTKYFSQLKNIGWYLGSSLFVAILGIVANPWFAKFLSPEDYSIIGYLASFSSIFLALSHFCFFSYYSRSYFFLEENKKESACNTLLVGLLGLGSVTYLLFIAILYVYWVKADVSIPFFPYALIYFIQQSIGNITSFYLVKLKVQRKAFQYGILTITNGLLSIVFGLFFVVALGLGALGKLSGLLLAAIAVGIYSYHKCLTNFEFDKDIFKNAVNFCFPLVISSLLFYFFNGFDRLLLEKVKDTYTYGHYVVGLQIAGYLSVMLMSMLNTFEPDIYQSIANNNFRRAILYMVLVLGIVAITNILFIAIAPFVIGLLTANRYVDASSFARIFALGNIATAIYYLVIRLFIAYGKTKYELLSRAISAVISVFIYKYLITSFGFEGGAWGQVLSLAAATLISIIVLLVVVKHNKSFLK